MVLRWREDSRPGDPETNMAVDLALLEEVSADPQALPIVRLYTWDRPSVSMGRLQDEQSVRSAFPGLPIIRRPTGGRAVLHGNDLTVTVVVRDTELPGQTNAGVLTSYRQIARGLLLAFQSLHIPAQFGGEASRRQDRGETDCFALAASCDLIEVGTLRKLAGCAQRRMNGVILQQASIPWKDLPTGEALPCAIKAGMQEALCVKQWVSVDTPSPSMIY